MEQVTKKISRFIMVYAPDVQRLEKLVKALDEGPSVELRQYVKDKGQEFTKDGIVTLLQRGDLNGTFHLLLEDYTWDDWTPVSFFEYQCRNKIPSALTFLSTELWFFQSKTNVFCNVRYRTAGCRRVIEV